MPGNGRLAAVGANTDTGRVREQNEDAFLAMPPLFAVADGVGGHAAGEVASQLAVRHLAESLPTLSTGGVDGLRDALIGAHQAIRARAEREPAASGMGTTCAILLLEGAKAHIAHVGDSRVYRLRSGVLEQLTQDHTLVGEMVTQGLLDADDPRADGSRSVLTRALGAGPSIEVDMATVELLAKDRFLLCSDGLVGMVPDNAIAATLLGVSNPQEAADSLIAAANAAGGEDNITVVVVDPMLPAGSGGSRARPRGRGVRRLLLSLLLTLLFVAIVALALGWSEAGHLAPVPSARQSQQP